jgi:hypothetical protein
MAYGLPSEGTRRLQLALGVLTLVVYLVTLVATIALHGAPYWAGWWVAMVLLAVVAFLIGRPVAVILEWIIAGYRAPA